MRHRLSALCRIAAWTATAAVCGWSQASSGHSSASSGAPMPFAKGEALKYSVNWPSGLDLGEAQFTAGGGAAEWQFEFTIEAGLPSLDIRDRYRASTSPSLCAESLEKEFVHGTRKGRETVTYDQEKHIAVRQTVGGGKSEIPIPECVKDGLTFLYFLRRELASGRIPPAQAVNFGSSYQVTVTYADSPQIEVSGARQPSDRVQITFRGPASSRTFEVFFGRDAARTPLLIRVPFDLGTFALELVR